MDKKEKFHSHSLLKLQLYKLYLDRFLSVLLASGKFNRIVVHDIFAGIGKSQDGISGSALIAAETLNDFIPKYQSAKISLNVNENNKQRFQTLQENMRDFCSFTSFYNLDANDYVSSWRPESGSNNLFFIDPYGYTQIDPHNLKSLLNTNFCDFLIFIPINHIYRFLKPSANKDNDFEDDNFLAELGISQRDRKDIDPIKYLEPVAKFLSGLGIEKCDAEDTETPEEFARIIEQALKRISNSDFVYTEIISGKRGKYALYFISKHILGAEKFLEAQKSLEDGENQTCFDFEILNHSKTILEYIKYDYPYNNIELYELGIKNGFLGKDFRKQILELEKTKAVSIKEINNHKRKQKGLYLGYDYWKRKEALIEITFQKQLF
jgi:three-Cys-motif partner protein